MDAWDALDWDVQTVYLAGLAQIRREDVAGGSEVDAASSEEPMLVRSRNVDASAGALTDLGIGVRVEGG